MILTTTDHLDGAVVTDYVGIVTGEAVLGTSILRDLLGNISDMFGGRTSSYEKLVARGKDDALKILAKRAEKLGASAVIGIDLDYQVLGEKHGLLMVTASGTAVRCRTAGQVGLGRSARAEPPTEAIAPALAGGPDASDEPLAEEIPAADPPRSYSNRAFPFSRPEQ